MQQSEIFSRLGIKGATRGGATANDAFKVPVLNAQGLLNVDVVPTAGSVAVYTVADKAARLALSGLHPGDFANQTDSTDTYVLTVLPGSVDGNWLQITNQNKTIALALALG